MSSTHDHATRLVALDLQIADLESLLKTAKDERKELVEHTLPTAMRQEQLTAYETVIGNQAYKLAIKHKVVGSLSRAKDADVALEYLAGKGFTGAAECVVSVRVPDEEREFITETLAMSSDTTPKVERKVNHMTLAAFARECISNGEGFDLEKVGLSALTETTIKETK